MLFGRKEVKVMEKMVKDPICGMDVDPNQAYYTEIGGKTHYFCGAGCKADFKKAQNKELYSSTPLKVRRSSRGGGGCCH
ncbi:MAG: YHS domain-containing protein [Thaumarchaeota archaeon]|nr:YHS domain-containing protein [Nitrososphaerota archaeon]